MTDLLKLIHKFTQSVLWSTVFLIITPYFSWRLLLSLTWTNKGDMKRTTPFQCFRKPVPEAAAAPLDLTANVCHLQYWLSKQEIYKVPLKCDITIHTVKYSAKNVNKILHRYYRINSVILFNLTSNETWLKSWICAVLHFTYFSPFFFSPCGYFNILLEYSVKLRMRVIDIPYVTLSMRSKHIRDVDMWRHRATVCSQQMTGTLTL